MEAGLLLSGSNNLLKNYIADSLQESDKFDAVTFRRDTRESFKGQLKSALQNKQQNSKSVGDLSQQEEGLDTLTERKKKRQKLSQPAATTVSSSHATPVYTSMDAIDAEEMQQIRGQNLQYEKAMKELLDDKRIPNEVRQKLKKQFPNLAASQQLVK